MGLHSLLFFHSVCPCTCLYCNYVHFVADTANELTVSLLAHWDVFSSGSKRLALYSAFGQLFMDWGETSVCALKHDFGNLVLFRLKKIHVDLSVAAPDILRSKKVRPKTSCQDTDLLHDAKSALLPSATLFVSKKLC